MLEIDVGALLSHSALDSESGRSRGPRGELCGPLSGAMGALGVVHCVVVKYVRTIEIACIIALPRHVAELVRVKWVHGVGCGHGMVLDAISGDGRVLGRAVRT